MKLEDINTEWKKDSVIDRENLDDDVLATSKLQQKYYEILIHERTVMIKKEEEYNKLKLEKMTYYVDGPSKEQIDKGWSTSGRRIIKTDFKEYYLEADDDLNRVKSQINNQKIKIDYLENILKMISNRGHHIRTAIDYIKFRSGV